MKSHDQTSTATCLSFNQCLFTVAWATVTWSTVTWVARLASSSLWSRTLALCAVLITTTHCAEGEAPFEPLTLEAASGVTSFMPVDTDEEVELVRGGQGGWHVWLSFRGTGLSSFENVPARITIERANSGEIDAESTLALDLDAIEMPDGTLGFEYLGFPAQFAEDAACVVDASWVVSVTVTRPAGLADDDSGDDSASASMQVVPIADWADAQDCRKRE